MLLSFGNVRLLLFLTAMNFTIVCNVVGAKQDRYYFYAFAISLLELSYAYR